MKRRVGLFLMVGAMVPLGVASTAWACASLATVSLSKSAVAPGETVTVTGKGYSDTHAGTNTGDSDVTLRLNGRRGQILGTTAADSSRRINYAMKVPNTVRSGYYIITATQFNANGTPKAGMPGRTVMRVTGSSASNNSAAVAPWSSSKPAGPAGSSLSVAGDGGGLSSQTLLLGMGLSLTLLAAGSVLVGRRNQTTSRLTLGV